MKSSFRFAALLATALTLSGITVLNADTAPLMSKDELKALLNDPQVMILDVRLESDWTSSEFKIPGAVHADPSRYQSWAEHYPRDKRLVLYCA